MQNILPKNLLSLSHALEKPLFLVGGCVRDFLAGLTPINGVRDFDICAPISVDEFTDVATQRGFSVKAVYRHTGTVKLQDQTGVDYEFSSFRSDEYVRGVHTPVEIFFTDDIALDARRRDFTANAVYYEIKSGKFVDPLDGIRAIQEKRLSTVAPAKKVFSEDGLRLMRLARQTAELGFTPDEECLRGASENANLILDISPERIFTELCAILRADCRFGITGGQYQGLALLDKTRVLDKILPELTLGRGMRQRADFHDYDVLEHSLRAVLYAEESVRLAALLHDVGKPFCTLRDGNAHAHPQEGASIAREILTRLKAPKKETERTEKLVEWHMYDFNCQTHENKLRRFFVTNHEWIDSLLSLKQADFSACKDDLSPAPTCKKWRTVLTEMQSQSIPFRVKDLPLSGKDLLALEIPASLIATTLNALLLHVATNPQDNEKARLCKLAKTIARTQV